MKLNAGSIRRRLTRLEQYIAELQKHQALTLEQLRSDFTVQLAVERAFQAGIESCADIASHIVSVQYLGHPQEQRDLFRLLAQAGYLEPAFADAMGEMMGFRNRIVHLYWDIDVGRLYDYLQSDVHLLCRFRDFALALLEAEGGVEEA